VSALEFLLADSTSPAWRSPLRRALERAPDGIRDVSALVDQAQVAGLGPAAGTAGIELEGPQARRLLQRLTELDLDALPAIGALAQVRTLLVAEAGDTYRLWFPQEYSDYLAEVVLDAGRGLGWA
jgi:sarcosine oxidase gamma subunit